MVSNKENKSLVKQVHSGLVFIYYGFCVSWNDHHQKSLKIDLKNAKHRFLLLKDHDVRQPNLSYNAECLVKEYFPTLSFKVKTFDSVSKSRKKLFVVFQDAL